jgi:hypothetical protein
MHCISHVSRDLCVVLCYIYKFSIYDESILPLGSFYFTSAHILQSIVILTRSITTNMYIYWLGLILCISIVGDVDFLRLTICLIQINFNIQNYKVYYKK